MKIMKIKDTKKFKEFFVSARNFRFQSDFQAFIFGGKK